MFKRIVVFGLVAVLAVTLSGCVTFGKKKDLEIQGLKNQVMALETQAQNKDQEIAALRDELSKATRSQEPSAAASDKGKAIEAKSHPKARDIQIALRNAGYDPGKIDGRMGKRTVEAVKAFQKANNLPVDGKVGKATWKALRANLTQKIK